LIKYRIIAIDPIYPDGVKEKRTAQVEGMDKPWAALGWHIPST
jgi:hypothetical protein